jgi:hypothetical protein
VAWVLARSLDDVRDAARFLPCRGLQFPEHLGDLVFVTGTHRQTYDQYQHRYLQRGFLK